MIASSRSTKGREREQSGFREYISTPDKAAKMGRHLVVVLVVGILVGFGLAAALDGNRADAKNPSTAEGDVAALKAQLDALQRLVPDQAHAMADVDYHFSNLWFAAENANWPLAEFYWGETRSHLNWAVRIRPVRRLSSGQDLDLRSVLQGVEASGLADLKGAIGKQDRKGFEAAYGQTIAQCHGCHTAAEKPYLLPHIPESPATRMIELKPKRN